MEFTADAHMVFASDNYQKSYTYTIENGNKITGKNDSTTIRYTFSIHGNELVLDGGNCIEACSYKYMRIHP